jgi:hypothetical protein
MKRRIIGSLAFHLVLLGSVANAQQEVQVDPLFKLDPQSRIKIQNLIDSAKLAELPWNALRLKAIEGANRKYEGRVVVDVVRKYYVTLKESKTILGPLASAEEIETGASALAAGLRSEDLMLFRVTTRGHSPTSALVYLADLVDKHNVPRDDAVSAFAKLWKDGAADSELYALWRGIDQDILSGVSPKAALQNRMRSLPPRPTKPPAEQDEENPRS